MSINEAMFLTDGERAEVMEAVEWFRKLSNKTVYVEDVTYQGRATGVRFLIDGDEKKFGKSPCTQPWAGYINEIKAWLFDHLEV